MDAVQLLHIHSGLPAARLRTLSCIAPLARLRARQLFAASVFFYAWWDYRWVPLLLTSILFNFVVGRAIAQCAGAGRARQSGWLLAGGIAINMLALCYFRYAGFLASNIQTATGWSLTSFKDIALPIGISFFTFTQIAFLVDSHRGLAREYRFIDYGLFVTWFPHLIAGPVLHHKEMMPQFRDSETFRFNWENLAVGLTVFPSGLRRRCCSRTASHST